MLVPSSGFLPARKSSPIRKVSHALDSLYSPTKPGRLQRVPSVFFISFFLQQTDSQFSRWQQRRVVCSHKFPGVVLSTRVPVFNRQIRPALSAFLQLSACFLFFFSYTCAASSADPLEDATRALASKVATLIHGGVVSFDQQNLALLDGSTFLNLSRAFQDELQRHGVEIRRKGEGAKLVLTVSESLTGYLGVVQIRQGEQIENVVVFLGRITVPEKESTGGGLTLNKELLFSAEVPMLDIVFLGSDREPLQVLTSNRITSYHREGERWQPGSSIGLPRNEPAGRELIGYLSIGIDDMSAVFPSEICSLSLTSKDACHPNKQHIGLSSIPQETLKGKKTPEWKSATEFQFQGDTAFLVAGRDGVLRLFEEGVEPVASFPGFGGEVTSFHSGCGTGWQVLTTGTGDWTAPDKLQAVELRDEKLMPVSPPLSLEGPILALRAGQKNNELQPVNAVAIVHNLQTGRYEAYRLTVTCSE
jgi:hypothetical protein